MEELQVGFAAQKKELEAKFVAQKKELEAEYQKQVGKMYFLGYRCCMKKNSIMHDISSLPSDDEDEILGGLLACSSTHLPLACSNLFFNADSKVLFVASTCPLCWGTVAWSISS